MMVARQKSGNAGRWLRPVIAITTTLVLLGCIASVAVAAPKPKPESTERLAFRA